MSLLLINRVMMKIVAPCSEFRQGVAVATKTGFYYKSILLCCGCPFGVEKQPLYVAYLFEA